jgi:hypothetical protein
MINRTLTLDIQATLAEINSYRSLLGYTTGIPLQNQFSQSRYDIPLNVVNPTTSQVSLGSVVSLFILITNVPVTVLVTDTFGVMSTFTVDSVMIITSACNSIVVQNPITNTTDALITVITG